MPLQFIPVLIKIAVDSCFFYRAVHALDLAVCPWMARFCKAMFDAMRPANTVKGMPSKSGRWTVPILWQIGKLNAIVSQHRVNLIGNSSNDGFQEFFC